MVMSLHPSSTSASEFKMTNESDLNGFVEHISPFPNFKRSISIVSLEDFVLSDEDCTLTQKLPLKRSRSSLDSSTVSVGVVSDDESCYSDSSVAVKRSTKRPRITEKKKSVHFADEPTTSCTTYSALQQTISIPVVAADIHHELFWSKKELQEIQRDCKVAQAADFEVQEYVEAFRSLQDTVMKESETSDPVHSVSASFDTVLDGLVDGWLGLERYGTSHAVQKTRTKQYTQSVITAQRSSPDTLAAMATRLSSPSVRWSVALGNASHKAAEL
jgi:hypothetical protein